MLLMMLLMMMMRLPRESINNGYEKCSRRGYRCCW